MKRIAKRFNIKQVTTTAYHPASNGTIERFHAVLVDYLKKFIESNDNWDQFLSLATFSYNTNLQDSHKFTPFELVFGRLPRTPSDDEISKEDTVPTYENYLVNLISTLNKLQNQARLNIIESKHKNKKYYDQRVNVKVFQLGEDVWLLKGGKIRKFEDHYQGPFKITETFPDGNVRIALDPNKSKIVHTNRLRHSHVESQSDQPKLNAILGK